MAAIITEKFRQTNADAFFTDVGTSKYYMFIGKSQPWTSEGATSDSNPPVPIDSVAPEAYYWDDMLGAKLISSKSYVIPRRNYSTSVPFDMYRHDISSSATTSSGASNLYDSTFYFMTSQNRVYKVLYNGDDAQTGASNITGSDPVSEVNEPFWHNQYYLKFMYKMSASDVQNFLTTDFMPVIVNDNNATSGGITAFLIPSVGSNYPNAGGEGGGATFYTKVRGDGSGGVLKLVVSGGNITRMAETGQSAVQTAGSGYTFASLDLDSSNIFTDTTCTTPIDATTGNTWDNATAATIQLMIEPAGGHGADDIEELGGHYVMLQSKFQPADADVVQVNDFRRIGIVKNPIDPQTTQISVQSTARTTNAIKLQSNAAFQVDEEIFQAGSHARGRVVEYDSTNFILYYIQEGYTSYGLSTHASVKNNVVSFNNSGQITGATSNVNGTPNSSQNAAVNGVAFSAGLSVPELNRDSGDIIYVENRRPISRASDQTEDIKVVVEF